MHAAFLQAILENPDDDTHRLIYADWLEDHGTEADLPQAQFIRAQCTLAALPEDDARRPALEKQEKSLLKKHGKRWLKALGIPASADVKWTFRRGFLDHVTASADVFVTEAETLFATVPTLRAARFPDASNEVDYLLECPEFARLTEVDLASMCSCGHCPILTELRRLFAAPQVAQLRVLNLADDRINLATTRALVESPHLGELRALDLSGNPLQTAGARVLAAAPFKHLTRLTLRSAGIGPTGGRAFAESKELPRLTTLDLVGNNLDAKTIAALRARFGDGLRV